MIQVQMNGDPITEQSSMVSSTRLIEQTFGFATGNTGPVTLAGLQAAYAGLQAGSSVATRPAFSVFPNARQPTSHKSDRFITLFWMCHSNLPGTDPKAPYHLNSLIFKNWAELNTHVVTLIRYSTGLPFETIRCSIQGCKEVATLFHIERGECASFYMDPLLEQAFEAGKRRVAIPSVLEPVEVDYSLLLEVV